MGAYTEYLAVKATAIARKPSNLSFEEAASAPVAAQTSWQGIFTHGHLAKGQTNLIHGGAGAVGAYAVQLASNADYRTVQSENAQSEKSLPKNVDVVLDLIGGDTQKRSFLVLKEGGYLVSAVQPVSQDEAAAHRVTGLMMRLVPSGDMLSRIGRLLEEGAIRPDVATVYALKDVAQAWNDVARNMPWVHGMPGPHGKIVLRVA